MLSLLCEVFCTIVEGPGWRDASYEHSGTGGVVAFCDAVTFNDIVTIGSDGTVWNRWWCNYTY